MESRTRRLALLWALAGALALVMAFGRAAPEPAPRVVLDEAQVSEVDGPAPFADPAQVRRRVLDDEWARWRDARSSPVWYRMNFVAPDTGDELTGLYIERVCSNLEVFVNGQRVHRRGRMDEPLTHDCSHPQLISLPAPLLQPGINQLDIRLAGHSIAQVASRLRAGALSAPVLGPMSALERHHAWQTALNVELPQAISATLVLMGGFMFVLGWRNRRESYLAYFGALSIGWALVEARLWWRDVPLSNSVVEFLLSSLFAFIVLAAVQFLLRLAHWRHRRVDAALALQCALLPATLVIAGPQRLHFWSSVWILVLAIEVFAAALFYLWLQWRARGGLPGAMTTLLTGIGIAIGIELLAQQISVPTLALQLAQLATPFVYVVVGLRLVQQHGHAKQLAEASRATLESRIREATAEIERNFKQMTELRVERVTERERKRIAADLHDDLGAKLLTIVHTSEDLRISTLAREALEEMRLSVRGLTGKPVRLGDALGDWRAEFMSRLGQSGIEAEWSSPEDLTQTLSARTYVQTTRILREATSNVIKHSGASLCTVRCTLEHGDFGLVIQDNGNGIPMELDGRLDRGHGVASMKSRAKQMAGQCLVESAQGFGTVIRLTLPLDRAIEPSA